MRRNLVLAVMLTGVAVSGPSPLQGSSDADFHLVGPAGRTYAIESFPARSVLVIYFGYTTCLAACPTALNTIAEAIDRLGPSGASIQPIFIDMDPDRAALVSLPLFMRAFGPNFLALTGSRHEVEQAARAFDVRVERITFSADPTDYAMKHTSPILVLTPIDRQALSLPAGSSPDVVAATLRTALRPAAGDMENGKAGR